MKPVKIFCFGLLVVLLAGCSQAFPTAQVSDLPTQPPTEVVSTEGQAEQPETVETPQAETPPPTAENAMTDDKTGATAEAETPPVQPTETKVAEPSVLVTETTPLGSPELHATDPSTVKLASGQVQLVEFFAFW